MTNKIKVGLH